MNKKNQDKIRNRSMAARAAAALLAVGLITGCTTGASTTAGGTQAGGSQTTAVQTSAGTLPVTGGTMPVTGGTMPGQTQPQGTQAQTGERLSAKDARGLVTERFGGIIQKIEYNYDDTNPLYKGEALKEGSKAVFELSAVSRKFEKWDEENDNSWNEFAAALPELITMEAAADSVIAESGRPNTFVQKIDFLWDDSTPMYQGEAFNEGVKYSFEIDARSGEFKKWDVDQDDETWVEQYSNVQ